MYDEGVCSTCIPCHCLEKYVGCIFNTQYYTSLKCDCHMKIIINNYAVFLVDFEGGRGIRRRQALKAMWHRAATGATAAVVSRARTVDNQRDSQNLWNTAHNCRVNLGCVSQCACILLLPSQN